MRTATEIFYDIRPELSAKDESGKRRPLDVALVEACDRVKAAYLSQRDVDGYEAACASQIFESLRALASLAAERAPPPRETPNPRPAESPASALAVAVGVLTAVAAASIVFGTTLLSLIVVGALGLASFFAMGGEALGYSRKRLPFLKLGLKAGPEGRKLAAGSQGARNDAIRRFEDALRAADAALTRLREDRPIELPPPDADAPPDASVLQFFQDLAEAGIAEDGALLVKLARRRLPAVLKQLNLDLVTSTDNAAWFVIDEIAAPNGKGDATTIRPAIARGADCLSRGYARRGG